MTVEELKAARELCEKASPGPWVVKIEMVGFDEEFDIPTADITNTNGAVVHSMADYELIAASRTLIPKLLDEIDRLKKEFIQTKTSTNPPDDQF